VQDFFENYKDNSPGRNICKVSQNCKVSMLHKVLKMPLTLCNSGILPDLSVKFLTIFLDQPELLVEFSSMNFGAEGTITYVLYV
jgi:hypothetical protein